MWISTVDKPVEKCGTENYVPQTCVRKIIKSISNEGGPGIGELLLRLRQAAPQIPLVVVGTMRSYEGYGFPFGMDITARTFEPLSLGQLEAYFCNFL